MIDLAKIRDLVSENKDRARQIGIGIVNEDPETFFWNSAIVWKDGNYMHDAWLSDLDAVKAYASPGNNWPNGWSLNQVFRAISAGVPTLRVFVGPFDYEDHDVSSSNLV